MDAQIAAETPADFIGEIERRRFGCGRAGRRNDHCQVDVAPRMCLAPGEAPEEVCLLNSLHDHR